MWDSLVRALDTKKLNDFLQKDTLGNIWETLATALLRWRGLAGTGWDWLGLVGTGWDWGRDWQCLSVTGGD